MSSDPPDQNRRPQSDSPPPRWRRLIPLAGWLWLALAIGLWGGLRAGDVWSPATVALFAPLHFLVVPPAVLGVAALAFRRRALATLIPALAVTAGPVSGLCLPWNRLSPEAPTGPRVRVLTCNMHYKPVPTGPLDRLIDESGPDVVALQEWSPKSESAALAEPGWHVHRSPGQFLASRYPIQRADLLGTKSTGPTGSVVRYELATPAGAVTLFSVHFASPRDGLSEVPTRTGAGLDELAANSELRWQQSRGLAASAKLHRTPVLLVGDFNTPPRSAIFRHVFGGYENAFSSAGWGWGHTFKARFAAVRIDHVLVGGGGRALECSVGPDVGSPHRPVLAEVGWPSAAP